VHVASLTTPAIGEANPYLELENIRLTLDLIAACERQHVKHIIFSSSGGTIYGETGELPATESTAVCPSCSYAIAKYASEELLRIAVLRGQVSATVLRISNVYGGRQTTKGEQGFIGYAVRRALENNEIGLYGDTVRDYIYIDDVVSAFVSALEIESAGFRCFNISTGVGTSLSGVVANLQEILGRTLKVRQSGKRPFDLQRNVLANGAAQKELNLKPTIELAYGLRRVVEQQSPSCSDE
jgi:UDP-glucose 4-epimerase